MRYWLNDKIEQRADSYASYLVDVAAGNIEYEDLLQWVLEHQN